MRHGSWMQNIVIDICAKFDNDRLRNDKALIHLKSDNNNLQNKHTNKNKNNNNNNVCGHREPVSGSKTHDLSQ